MQTGLLCHATVNYRDVCHGRKTTEQRPQRKDRDVTIPCLKSLRMPTSFDQLIYKCEAELVGS